MPSIVQRMQGKRKTAPTPPRGTPVLPQDPTAPRPSTPDTPRSTRRSGKPEFFQPLEGAPTGKKRTAPKTAPPLPKRTYHSTDDDSDNEIIYSGNLKRKTPTKAAPKPPAKRTRSTAPSHLPSPARSTASSPSSTLSRSLDDDEDESEEDMIVKKEPPARKRATRTKTLPLPPSPVKTPTKPKVSSPLKKVARRVAASVSDSEQEQEDQEMDEAEVEPEKEVEQSEPEEEDEIALIPTPPASSTPRKTPAKKTASRSTPASTPSRSSRSASTTVTPSRSSHRIQRLPASVADIENAPANLRNRLVGFHMEDEGYGKQVQDEDEESDEEEEDEEVVMRRRAAKGKGRATEDDEEEQEDASMADVEQDELPLPSLSVLPTPPSSPASSAYLASPLHTHLTSALAVLSGQRLPRPALAKDAQTTLPPREVGVTKFPYLEGGYDEWERPLRGALDEVVTKGMGNAVMLLGPRGVGKTMIIERTLSVLSYVHGPSAFATVRLSGLVHTTDRLALRSVAVQLQQQGFGGREFDIDDGDFSSNSATMSSLLRLLEPSSSASASTAGASASTSASTSTEETKSKPLVLIVDEFDLFAQHPRQSFLYCLLDIVQGNRRRGGVAVVGVSSRVDCLSLLEKRVRSRCQSHVLQVMPSSSLDAFLALAKRLMRADERLWELERGSGSEEHEWAKGWNEAVEVFVEGKKVEEYLERVWMVGGNVPTELRGVISHIFYRLDYLSRQSASFSPIPKLSFSLLPPLPSSSTRDPVLSSLTTLELNCLVGCKHLSASTADRQTGFNFEMLWEGYAQHAQRASVTGGAVRGVSAKSYSKAAMREAFDSLRAHELLLPRSSSSTAASTNTAGLGGPVVVPSLAYQAPVARDPFRLYRLVTWAKDVDDEVEARKGGECPEALRRWCKNWLA
ncbi:hypothetical protein JCM8097_004062 [Rhodosporidiobolus ruineniae]